MLPKRTRLPTSTGFLGATVTQNILLCGKKVDILAVFRVPGSSGRRRVIVECKNEGKRVAQNQRVLEFIRLLETARKAREADSAEIVTEVDWGDAAKAAARSYGIQVCTYAQKTSQLVDFGPYLRGLVRKFDNTDPERSTEPPLGSCFIDLTGRRTEADEEYRIPRLSTYLLNWTRTRSLRGTLPSSATMARARARYLRSWHETSPRRISKTVVIDVSPFDQLATFYKAVKIESQVVSFLDEECGIQNPKFRLFQEMNSAGAFVLIFDGLDEMAVKVDRDVLETNLHEIDRLAAAGATMAVMTCRPEYFISGQEEIERTPTRGRPTRDSKC